MQSNMALKIASSKVRKLLLSLLMLVSTSVQSSELSLVLPVWNYHVQHQNLRDYTEGFNNRGVGLNMSIDNLDVGFIYIGKDSFNVQSAYAYMTAYTNTPVQFGAGLAFAVRFKEDPQQREYNQDGDSAIMPVLTVKYKYLRVTTSYPSGKLAGADADLVTVQLLLPVGGI